MPSEPSRTATITLAFGSMGLFFVLCFCAIRMQLFLSMDMGFFWASVVEWDVKTQVHSRRQGTKQDHLG